MVTGTIFDYVLWRGDLSFNEVSFNYVDNLIFSFLAYADFQNIKVSEEENEKGLTVKEYYDRLMESGGFPKELDLLIKNEEFKVIAESKRFGSVLIKHYIDIVKNETNTGIQFSAMDFHFDENKHYIGFRGTDDSIAGWKEDLAMTYTKIPAQDLATDYLEKHIEKGNIYYVGGHSKGANLSIYAASNVSKEKYDLIKQIFANDGPGLCEEVMDPNILKSIDEKTVKIIPSYSVIGMCFSYPFSHCLIVNSLEKGLMQHNIKSWLVIKNGLSTTDHLNPECVRINETIALYIKSTPMENREKILSDIFDAFDDGGKKKTVSSVRNGGFKELQRFLLKLSSKNRDTRSTVTKLPFMMIFGRAIASLRHFKPIEFFVHNTSILLGLIYISLGLVFLLLPISTFSYIIGALCISIALVESIMYLYYLYLTKWNFKQNMLRLYISILFISLSIAYFTSPNSMLSFSAIIFGIVMMIGSFSALGNAIELYKIDNFFSLLVSILEFTAMFATSIYSIIINFYSSDIVGPIGGVIFIIIGSMRIVSGFWDLIRKHKKSSIDK